VRATHVLLRSLVPSRAKFDHPQRTCRTSGPAFAYLPVDDQVGERALSTVSATSLDWWRLRRHGRMAGLEPCCGAGAVRRRVDCGGRRSRFRRVRYFVGSGPAGPARLTAVEKRDDARFSRATQVTGRYWACS